MFRNLRLFGFAVAALTGTLCSPAHAQTDLFKALPSNQLADATPEQAQRLAKVSAPRTVQSVHLVTVDPSALQGDQAIIWLPDAGNMRADKKKVTVRSNSDYSWFGDVQAARGPTIFVVRNGEITGHIWRGLEQYSVTPIGGGVHAIAKINQKNYPPDHDGPSPIAPKIPDTFIKKSTVEQPDLSSPQGVQVDVLIVWTAAAAAANGGNMAAYAQLSVDTANAAYDRSNANVTLRLVGAEAVSYVEPAANSTASFNTVLNDLTSGAPLAGVRTLRDSVGADMAAIFISNPALCGLAWLGSSATTAFSVTEQSCAVGNNTFAHELGHNFGSLHDPINDPSTSPFAYGHGFIEPSNGWRTIMSVAASCGNCPRIPHFSNPSINNTTGAPVGPTGNAAVSDNARVHRERVATVAAFRSPAATSTLVAAVLPYARSVQIGAPATAFATIINAGSSTATGCSIALPAGAPAGTFSYQTASPANTLTGTPNTPVDIAAGAAQQFVFGFTPSAAFAATDIQLVFDCANTSPVVSFNGLNTFLLSASASPVPDMVAISATAGNNGIVDVGTSSGGAFATAAINIGVAGSITASVDTGTASISGLSLSLCPTNQTTGACTSPPSATVTQTINNNQVVTYAIFATAASAITLDPATKRVFLRLASGGVVRGATSVAVRTVAGDAPVNFAAGN